MICIDRFSSSLDFFRFSLRCHLCTWINCVSFCFTFLFGVEYIYDDWKTLYLDLFGSLVMIFRCHWIDAGTLPCIWQDEPLLLSNLDFALRHSQFSYIFFFLIFCHYRIRLLTNYKLYVKYNKILLCVMLQVIKNVFF